MKREITSILDEARRAPSVLNSQPWGFRVCGNTIEVYLEKNPELATIDTHGRLQLASCGTLIAHLKKSIRSKGWVAKTKYFPRFEEENLVAYVEVKGLNGGTKQSPSTPEEAEPETGTPDTLEVKQKQIAAIASREDIGLLIHDDGPDNKVQNYFKDNCGEKLNDENFRKNLNLFMRPDSADTAVPFEDEALLSDRFFESDDPVNIDGISWPDTFRNRYFVLVTGTDNRYEWTRAGEALGNIMLEVREWDAVGLMALPIITDECCRKWLKDELNIRETPQFVLKMQPVKPKEHIHKRPLKEMLKYGF